MGKYRKTVADKAITIQISMPYSDNQKLEAKAKKEDRSKSEIIRMALQFYYNHHYDTS